MVGGKEAHREHESRYLMVMQSKRCSSLGMCSNTVLLKCNQYAHLWARLNKFKYFFFYLILKYIGDKKVQLLNIYKCTNYIILILISSINYCYNLGTIIGI